MSSERFPSEDAAKIGAAYSQLPATEAVAIAGSYAAGIADGRSDLDVYVYSREPPGKDERAAIASRLGSELELGETLWEDSDHWKMLDSSLHVDVIFRTRQWIEERLAAVLDNHDASLGYTTSLWYNVLHSRSLFDRAGWFEELQAKCRCPYPDGLQASIIAKNFPVLGSIGFSYIHQIELALQRRDAISALHRTTAYLESYFDVLFAANRQPHPGEKRLLTFAHALCPNLPEKMDQHIETMTTSSFLGPDVLAAAKQAEANMRHFLHAQGLLSPLSAG